MGASEKNPPSVEELVKMAKALASPVRIRMIRALEKAGEASPADLGRELDVSTPKAVYHMEKLETAGLVERVGTRKVRGATAGLFRLTGRKLLSDEDQARITVNDERFVVRGEVWLDDQGGGEVTALVEGFQAELALVGGRVDARTPPPFGAGILERVEVIRQPVPKGDRPLE